MFKYRLILIALLCISPWILAEDDELVGDRPDMTESAVTVGHMKIQIETGVGWEHFEDGSREENSWFMPTLFRLGLGDSFEVRLETAAFSRFSFDYGAVSDSFTGFSPITFGVKYNFNDGSNGPAFGILLNMEVPSGTDEFETEEYAWSVKILNEFGISDNMAFATNLGLESATDDIGEDFTTIIATGSLGIGLTDRAGAFVELAFSSDESSYSDEAAWIFDAGLTYLMQKGLQVDIAAGTGLAGEFVPDFFLTSGVIFKF